MASERLGKHGHEASHRDTRVKDHHSLWGQCLAQVKRGEEEAAKGRHQQEHETDQYALWRRSLDDERNEQTSPIAPSAA